MIHFLTSMSILLSFFNLFSGGYKKPEYVALAENLRGEFADRYAKKHKMDVIGLSGMLFDKVNGLGFSFKMVGPISKEELRIILVNCTEEFLEKINKNEKIRKYLKIFPFTYREIDVAIFLSDCKGYDLYYPEYSVASLSNGSINFWTNEKNTLGFFTEEEEPYEEALKIVMQQKNQSKHND